VERRKGTRGQTIPTGLVAELHRHPVVLRGDRPVQLQDRAFCAGAAKTRDPLGAGEQIVEPDTTVRVRAFPTNPEPLNAFPGGLRRAG
jgi:hypothetical protein